MDEDGHLVLTIRRDTDPEDRDRLVARVLNKLGGCWERLK